VILFVSTFAAVFLLSFQQQNVVGGHYALAFITSIGIAIAQFSMFKGVIAADWTGAIMMGLGGACGVMLSMWTHRKLVRK